MTNREFLNRLSDEGMAIFIDTLSDAEHEPCQYCSYKPNSCNQVCVDGVLEWLKMEEE